MLDNIISALGYKSLKPEQIPAITAFAKEQDVFMCLSPNSLPMPHGASSQQSHENLVSRVVLGVTGVGAGNPALLQKEV